MCLYFIVLLTENRQKICDDVKAALLLSVIASSVSEEAGAKI